MTRFLGWNIFLQRGHSFLGIGFRLLMFAHSLEHAFRSVSDPIFTNHLPQTTQVIGTFARCLPLVTEKTYASY